MSEPKVSRKKLRRALLHEQLLLWTDLSSAIRRARNCVWSIEAEDLRDRIVRIAGLVGPTHWTEVPTDLLALRAAGRRLVDVECGVPSIYETVLTEANIPFEPVDRERVAKVRGMCGS